ncbi:MAG: ribokinase, partial [Promethearchaeia archaeon]
TFKQYLGGKGANQAVAAARSGADTIFIGKIGQDKFGDQMMSQLHSEGINTDHIIRDPDEASGVAFILIDKDGENMISVAPGANAKLSPRDIEDNREIIINASAIITQMEIPIETIEKIYRIAAEGDAIKILNPAPLKPIPKNLLKDIDIVIPNEGELYRLHKLLNLGKITESSREAMKRASQNISNLGIKTIITTLGNKGSLYFNLEKDLTEFIPAIQVQVEDTVGAGDCFNGVLASMLTQNRTLLEAIKYATAAAALAVTREGAQNSMPNLMEIEEMVKNFNF